MAHAGGLTSTSSCIFIYASRELCRLINTEIICTTRLPRSFKLCNFVYSGNACKSYIRSIQKSTKKLFHLKCGDGGKFFRFPLPAHFADTPPLPI